MQRFAFAVVTALVAAGAATADSAPAPRLSSAQFAFAHKCLAVADADTGSALRALLREQRRGRDEGARAAAKEQERLGERDVKAGLSDRLRAECDQVFSSVQKQSSATVQG